MKINSNIVFLTDGGPWEYPLHPFTAIIGCVNTSIIFILGIFLSTAASAGCADIYRQTKKISRLANFASALNPLGKLKLAKEMPNPPQYEKTYALLTDSPEYLKASKGAAAPKSLLEAQIQIKMDMGTELAPKEIASISNALDEKGNFCIEQKPKDWKTVLQLIFNEHQRRSQASATAPASAPQPAQAQGIK